MRFALAAAVAATLSLAVPAAAESVQVGDITVTDPWARASAGHARAGAAFMVLDNTGADDKLIKADADVSEKVELHTHINDDGVMRMREVPFIAVPDGTTDLKPGGLHVMFIGLKAPLEEGSSFPLTLTFEEAGDVTVDVTVKGPGAMGHGMSHGHGSHH